MFRSRLQHLTVVAASAVTITTVTPPDPSKLPLHDTPTTPILLVELPPSQLEQRIGAARRAATEVASNAHAKVQGVVDKWIGVEHAIETRVKSIITPSEPLTPGILYVGIATLTGSIISRSRGLPTRLILPPILFLASFQHFLPKTTANLGAYISLLERAHLPALAEKHREAEKRLCDGWRRAKQRTREGNERVVESVNTAVKRLQGFTGLKLQEAFALRHGFMATTPAKAPEPPLKESRLADPSSASVSPEEKAPAKATRLV